MAEGTYRDDDRSAFDPASWMELIGEVQRLGIETARAVAGRFTDLADRDMRARAQAPVGAAFDAWRAMVDRGASPATQEQFVAAAQTLTAAFVDMMQAAWGIFAESAGWVGFPGATSTAVDFGRVAPGETAVARAYVHVGTGGSAGAVALRPGELTTAAGVKLGSAVRPNPPSIDSPAAGRSYPIALEVAVPVEAGSGSYHGFLFAATKPEAAVALHLEVAG